MPSPFEWRDHKSQILALIAENNLATVVEKMKEHGFTASKAQYEQQFVKWNARKNLKKGEWRTAITVYDSLVTRHGERNVRLLISDIPVPKTRILQNRRRYCRGESRTMDLVTDSGKYYSDPFQERTSMTDIEDIAGHLPRRVSFRVLRAHGDWMSPPPDELRIGRSSTAGSPIVSNSPILSATLEDVLDVAIPDLVPNSPLPAFSVWENLEDPAILPTAASGPHSSLSVLEQRHGSLSPFSFSPRQLQFSPTIWSEYVAVTNDQKSAGQILFDLGFFQFEKQLLEGTGATDLQTWLAGHIHFLQSPTIQFLSCVKVPQRSPFNLLNTHLAEHHYVHSLMQPFMTLLPGEDLSSVQNVANFDAHIHRLLLFSFANGFSGLEMVDLTRVLGFLSHYKNIGALLMQLKGIPGPYSKAIAVGVFTLCVESGEAQVAQQLLETKCFNINTIIISQDGDRLTPLERTSQLQDADMIGVLLAIGASVNKSFELNNGPLSRLLRGSTRGTIVRPTALRAVSQLLDAGARVRYSDLFQVLRPLHAKDLGFKVALRLFDQDPEAWLSNDLLSLAADELNEQQISKIMSKVLPRCEIHEGRYSGRSSIQIHQALVSCASKGHFKLVETLLHHDTHPVTDVLCGAIRGGHRDLVEMIVSEYASSLSSDSHNVSCEQHPLTEAIWAEDDDLIRLCEENESLSHLQDHHVEVALDAAASTGNLKYVCKLLEHFRYSDPSVLTQPLLHAIQGGYKDIYMMLLNAGADVNLRSHGSPSPSDPFMAAITQGDRSLVSAIMDANLDGKSYYDINGKITTALSALIQLDDQSLITKALHLIPSHLRLRESDVKDIVTNRRHGMFQFLLDQKAFRHTAITARLKLAAKSNDWTTVREMLSLGANPGNVGVMESAADASLEMFQFLFEKLSWSVVPSLDDSEISREYNLGVYGARLLQHIIEKGVSGLPVLAFIIEEGKLDLNCQPARPYLTPLEAAIAACSSGCSHGFTATRMLLDAGCNPNAIIEARGSPLMEDSSIDGNLTPLLLAIELKRTDLVALLLEKQADVNKGATLGIPRTPLQRAAELGCLEIVKLLLSKGAIVNALPAFRTGGTALQLAAISGNCNIVCVLLEHGADLSQRPRVLGRWPLEGAAEHGRLAMIDYLWQISGDKGFSDEICERAIELAGENGHEACQDMIRELRRSKSPSTCDLMSGILYDFQ
ncbi:hypothetical protein PG984_005194 [Apiospora sp. TS-2023a]